MTITLHQAPNGRWVAAIEHAGRVVKLFQRDTPLAATNAARDWLANTAVTS